MMKKYRCKETFYIDKYDEDGFWMEKQMAVVKGSKWQRVIILKIVYVEIGVR